LTYNQLTKEEEDVMLHKGTEPPFTGIYNDHWEKGIYLCKRCDTPLFRSEDKFNAGCGWPSFDDEIPNRVKRSPDPDGIRTEISCANCGAHLGHVFQGEGFTYKNTRHCVNSISLKFQPVVAKRRTERAIFAGGCFWGVEYYLQPVNGVISTTVGFIGGHKENPSYQDVCYKDTGHAEAVEVVYDPDVVSYEQLAKLFFEIHDPTQINRQGPDVGEQYRSEIFYLNEEQKATAERLIEMLRAKGYHVATKVTPAGTFWKAEEYHQDYYGKTGGAPYCHRYEKRF